MEPEMCARCRCHTPLSKSVLPLLPLKAYALMAHLTLFVIFICVQTDGYDPNKSRVSDDKMRQWNQTVVTGDLNEVPGIGPAAIKALAIPEENGDVVTNTFQLFGKFLMLKGPGDITPAEHTERMWYWLKNRGINSCRSGIVRCLAEKGSTFFPSIYDANDYDDSDDEIDGDDS